jgi:hypothetical protein
MVGSIVYPRMYLKSANAPPVFLFLFPPNSLPHLPLPTLFGALHKYPVCTKYAVHRTPPLLTYLQKADCHLAKRGARGPGSKVTRDGSQTKEGWFESTQLIRDP